MSRSRHARRVAAPLAVLAALAAAGPAHASTTIRDIKTCAGPIFGNTDVNATLVIDEGNGQVHVSADLTLVGSSGGNALRVFGAKAIEGTVDTRLTHLDDDYYQLAGVALAVPKTPVPPENLTDIPFTGTGATTFTNTVGDWVGGSVDELHLRMLDAAGKPFVPESFAPLPNDDGDYTTLDMPCREPDVGPTPTPAPVTPTPEPATPTPSPIPEPPSTFSVTGTTTLKTLTKGSVPVTGSVVVRRNGADFAGDLTLNSGIARLNALGVVPLTARLTFVPQSQLTGTFSSGASGSLFTGSVKTQIKLSNVTLFGFAVNVGSNCSTAGASVIKLSGPFGPFGGTMAGTYSIGSLANCGALTGVLSPVIAGNNNAIALTLK